MIKLGDKTAKHQYEIGVKVSIGVDITDIPNEYKNGAKFQIIVDANTRSQAAKIAKDSGFVVCDVNMIG